MSYTRGRTTIYKGIKMRSRLEASFAALLDSLDDITWTYEPQCFADANGQYLPDFLVLYGDLRDYMEVKPPTADTFAALLKMHVIRSSEPEANLYVWVPTGVYPNQGFAQAARCRPDSRCAHCNDVTFRDLRMVPGADRKTISRTVPVDPVTGRATIGGRARKDDRTVGGYERCSPEETAAFLEDRPWP